MGTRADVPRSLQPRGSAAHEIADLWWLLAGVGAAVFAIVVVALVVGTRRGEHDRVEASAAGRRWMLLGGVVLPTVVIAGILVATVSSMRALSSESDADLTVRVTGHQWWWEIRYPAHGVVTANEIHVPVGHRVLLELRSADVIHSFWVPELAGKMDLLPERANTLVIDADSPGRYEGQCAEFCGIQHANMGLVVVAETDADFAAWLADQARPAAAPDSELAERGAAVFASEGCASCHRIGGTDADGRAGPDLTHLADRSSLGAGASGTAMDDLRAWVTDPHAVKDGVLMPAFDLEPDEIDALVAYLDGLR